MGKLGLALILCAALAGCDGPDSWVPRGEVRFLELRERVEDSGLKSGTLEYSITNLGKARIAYTVFAFTFSTDAAAYRCTIVDENPVAEGALVYGSVTLAYDSAAESGDLADAVVDSAQFN
jgi:hypothetical protein